jgi:hypothetical protein
MSCIIEVSAPPLHQGSNPHVKMDGFTFYELNFFETEQNLNLSKF